MTRPPTPPSPRWSRNWPDLDIELKGSPRLATAWALWCLALGLALGRGTGLPMVLRSGLMLLTLVLGWGGIRRLRARRSCDIRRLRWQADGRWWLQERSGRGAYVQPQVPQRLGALLWLRWRDAGCRRLLVIDGAVVEPNDWRRLKARLKFARS